MDRTPTWEPRDPGYRERVSRVIAEAPFVAEMGIRLVDLGPGWCETEMAIRPQHAQHHGVVHAGVQATLADHTAGAAGSTLIAADALVLSAEFHMSLLRPASGQTLRCRAEVLKSGRSLLVVESEVFALSGENESLTVKATVTLAVVKRARMT